MAWDSEPWALTPYAHFLSVTTDKLLRLSRFQACIFEMGQTQRQLPSSPPSPVAHICRCRPLRAWRGTGLEGDHALGLEEG